MNRKILYPVLTVVFTVATITVNALANILPFNGQQTGEISDRFDIYFVPAGYVFSIWGLIYVLLIGYAVYQALPAQRSDPLLQRIAPAYWLGSLANSIWVVLWHYEFFTLTLLMMLTLLGTLLYIYLQLRGDPAGFSGGRFWFLKLPFSVYLGWISVATIANISQVLFFLDWGGWGLDGAVWAVIMIATAALLGGLMQVREKDLPYAWVLVWAFAGIAVSQAGTAIVVWAAWIGCAVLLGIGLFVWLRGLNRGAGA